MKPIVDSAKSDRSRLGGAKLWSVGSVWYGWETMHQRSSWSVRGWGTKRWRCSWWKGWDICYVGSRHQCWTVGKWTRQGIACLRIGHFRLNLCLKSSWGVTYALHPWGAPWWWVGAELKWCKCAGRWFPLVGKTPQKSLLFPASRTLS